MRRTILTVWALVAVTLSASWIIAGEKAASLWRPDARSAWKASQASGRPLLLYVTSRYCPYCDLMERDTFSDPAVQELMRDSFEPVRVLADQEPNLTRNLRVQAYPTTVVVDSDNRVLASIKGYVQPRAFEQQLRDAAVQ
jgi:thioredoxin-related protein